MAPFDWASDSIWFGRLAMLTGCHCDLFGASEDTSVKVSRCSHLIHVLRNGSVCVTYRTLSEHHYVYLPACTREGLNCLQEPQIPRHVQHCVICTFIGLAYNDIPYFSSVQMTVDYRYFLTTCHLSCMQICDGVWLYICGCRDSISDCWCWLAMKP